MFTVPRSSDSQIKFFKACKEGDLDYVKAHLREINVNKEISIFDGMSYNFRKESPLYAACENNQLDIVKLLLLEKKEIDVNVGVDEGSQEGEHVETPLYVSCSKGYFEIVKELLKNEDIKVNEGFEGGHATDNKITPLFVACSIGNVDIVKELLKHKKIDVNTGSIDKEYKFIMSPLYIACKMKHFTVVDELLKCEKINLLLGLEKLPFKSDNSENSSCLFLLVSYGKKKYIKIFNDKVDITKINADEIKQDEKNIEAINLLKEYQEKLKSGWSIKTHKYFPKKLKKCAEFLFLFDLRKKYLPTEIKMIIMSFLGNNEADERALRFRKSIQNIHTFFAASASQKENSQFERKLLMFLLREEVLIDHSRNQLINLLYKIPGGYKFFSSNDEYISEIIQRYYKNVEK